MSALERYRSKRDPSRTPEPMPGTGEEVVERPGSDPPHFVVQEHHARALHWDLRLEHDGVFASWAVPKGLPPDRGTNNLAVRVEDHPLEYGAFEGSIPKGEYGAGQVSIWDRGTYECEKWTDREVKVTLHGTRVDGRYALFQTHGQNWMIHRMDHPPQGWEPVPQVIAPMLAVTGPLPSGPDWAFEFKWDGMRAVVYVEGGRVRILSRNDLDVTASFPELHALGQTLGSVQAVLDGEVVALDDQGRPSFGALQQRLHVVGPARVRRIAEQVPVTYMIFDVLHLEGHATLELPYEDRRSLLDSLALNGPSWATPRSQPGPGDAVLRASVDGGLEGVVAKRTASPYLPGRRSADWVKVKSVRTQEVVVGGWTSGEGRRSESIGALLLGIPDEAGLRYVGKVGTGFDEAALRDLSTRLSRLSSSTNPFVDPLPRAQVANPHWAVPELVGEVRFSEWTKDGRLRHPSWRGLRPEKTPGEVVRES